MAVYEKSFATFVKHTFGTSYVKHFKIDLSFDIDTYAFLAPAPLAS